MADRRLPFLVAGSALAGLVVSLTGCDSSRSPTEPDPEVILEELTEQVETVHFIFHFAPGDQVDAERQEAHHRWATGRLGVGLPQKIEYFKYRDRNHMQRLTGRFTNGWADPDGFAVHAIQPANAHEAVHVYAGLLGRPSDFFDEGLAVALTTNPLTGDYEPTYGGFGSAPKMELNKRQEPRSRPARPVTVDRTSIEVFIVSKAGIKPLRAATRI